MKHRIAFAVIAMALAAGMVARKENASACATSGWGNNNIYTTTYAEAPICGGPGTFTQPTTLPLVFGGWTDLPMTTAPALTTFTPVPATAAATTTSTTTTRTAPTTRPVSQAAMNILKRLEAAGKKHPRIAADLNYVEDQQQTGLRQERTGRIAYQAAEKGRSAKFRVSFKTLRTNTGPKTRRRLDYAFDGQYLSERKDRIKQLTHYQVAPPGQQADPMGLGEGPFPVPFGQDTKTVLKHFRPSTRPPVKTDPKGADYIRLDTRPAYKGKLSVLWLEMWVDRKTDLPVKMISEDRSETKKTVLFTNIKTPDKLPADEFKLKAGLIGWTTKTIPWTGQIR